MIEISALFPVYSVGDLASLRDFYTATFGFEVIFYQADFYLHLLNPKSMIQVGFLMESHASQPAFLQSLATHQGQVLSFEVESAAAAYDVAKTSDLDVVMDIKVESWGQTHFMVKDPAGLVIDIVEHYP